MAKLNPEDLRDEPETDLHARIPWEQFPHEKFIAEIKGLLVGCEYGWAESTLRGILETVERTQKVSEGQRNAIDRIKDRPDRGGDRRYRGREGW